MVTLYTMVRTFPLFHLPQANIVVMKSFAFGLAVILAAVLVGGAQGVTQGNCSNSQLGTNSQLGCAYCPTIGGETSECVATGCKVGAVLLTVLLQAGGVWL